MSNKHVLIDSLSIEKNVHVAKSQRLTNFDGPITLTSTTLTVAEFAQHDQSVHRLFDNHSPKVRLSVFQRILCDDER